eukprot:5749766-Alexandrium_andersonii.AAC.1
MRKSENKVLGGARYESMSVNANANECAVKEDVRVPKILKTFVDAIVQPQRDGPPIGHSATIN